MQAVGKWATGGEREGSRFDGPVPIALRRAGRWLLNRAARDLTGMEGHAAGNLADVVHPDDLGPLADVLDGTVQRAVVRTLAVPPRTLQIDRHHGAEPVLSLADVSALAADRDWLAVEGQELKHRIRNLFAVVAGLARMGQAEGSGASEELASRVQALGVAQAALDAPGGMPVDRLCRAVLEPFWRDGRIEISACCPAVHLPGDKATPIALALNELATNAVKHGALSTEKGRLTVRITADAGRLRLDWVENGVGEARLVAGGFGTRLLAMSIERQLGGRIDRHWQGGALRIGIEVPIAPACCCARVAG